MGFLKKRSQRQRMEQNKRPDQNWEDGVRITSACPDGCVTYWAHLSPRINCPLCGAFMVTTETDQ